MAIGSAGTLEKSDYVSFLKEWYQGTVVADLVYDNHPWLGMVPKAPNVRGNVYPKPIRYANITGQSSTYASAHANQGPATRDRWELTHVDNYAKATVSNKVMELSLGDPAAFREALRDAVDSAYSAFANDLHFELLAAYPYGARAQVTTFDDGGLADTIVDGLDVVVTLSPGEARFFEKGMYITHSAVADHSAELDSGETTVVKAVDRANDTITIDNWATTTLVETDRIYRAGDHSKKADSLVAWLPGSAVTAALFNGVNRSDDPTRKAGVDGIKGTDATNPYLDHLVQTGAALFTQGQAPNICLMHPTDQAGLAFETESRGARYIKTSATSGSLSFSALQVMTGGGAVPVVADPAVKPDTSFMGKREAVELFSAGGVPRMFRKDGNFYHREETADTLAFYLFGFYNQCIQAPVTWAYTADIV